MSETDWHAQDVQEVLDRLHTSAEGLSNQEAARLLGEVGPNRLSRARPVSALRILTKHAFVFTDHGRRGPRARHAEGARARAGDAAGRPVTGPSGATRFFAVAEGRFRDSPLAAHVCTIEDRIAAEDPADIAADIAQSIRARYETAAGNLVQHASS